MPSQREQAGSKRAIAERARFHADQLCGADQERLRQYADELEAEAVELERVSDG